MLADTDGLFSGLDAGQKIIGGVPQGTCVLRFHREDKLAALDPGINISVVVRPKASMTVLAVSASGYSNLSSNESMIPEYRERP